MVIDGVEYVKSDTIKYIRQPRYREGQVVFWGNGRNAYVQIMESLPLHCSGASYSYRVCTAGAMRECSAARLEGPVSEDVLRPLRGEELGLSV